MNFYKLLTSSSNKSWQQEYWCNQYQWTVNDFCEAAQLILMQPQNGSSTSINNLAESLG
jgi:hypothetical protein